MTCGRDMMRQMSRPAARRAGTALLAAMLLSAGQAGAQSTSGPLDFLGNLFGGPSSKPGQTPQAAPAPSAPASGAPQPWSGEDGASGHPLMTAVAIREAAAN